METETETETGTFTNEQLDAWRKWSGRHWLGDRHLESDIAHFDYSQVKQRRMGEAEAYFMREHGDTRGWLCEQPLEVQKKYYEKFGLEVLGYETFGDTYNPHECRLVLNKAVRLECDLTPDERRYELVLDVLRVHSGLPEEQYKELKQRLREYYWSFYPGGIEEEEV